MSVPALSILDSATTEEKGTQSGAATDLSTSVRFQRGWLLSSPAKAGATRRACYQLAVRSKHGARK